MFEILTLNKIAKCGLAELDPAKYTITDDATKDADGIILRSFKMHDMELLPTLKQALMYRLSMLVVYYIKNHYQHESYNQTLLVFPLMFHRLSPHEQLQV